MRGHYRSVSKAEKEAREARKQARRAANRLVTEKDSPLLSRLGQIMDALPKQTVYIPTERGGNVVDIAVHQLSSGQNRKLVIAIHGLVANSETWRHALAGLAKDHDLWTFDNIGCGLSGKPHPKSLKRGGYSPTAMGERNLQALRELFARRERAGERYESLTLVAHSLGGMVAIRMFSHPELRAKYADVLERVDRLVLAAPSDVSIQAEMPVFREIVDLKDWQVWLGKRLGLVRKAAIASTQDGHANRGFALKQKAVDLERVLSNPPTRRAAQAMIKQGVPWNHKLRRPDWNGISELNAHYANIDIPILIVWGDRDEILPVSMGHKLQAEIPGAELVRFADANHSVHAEKPVEFAKLVWAYEDSESLAGLDVMPKSRFFANGMRAAIYIAER